MSSTTIFQQPGDEEFVERDTQGEFKIAAPHHGYRNMALGLMEEADAETSTSARVVAMSSEGY